MGNFTDKKLGFGLMRLEEKNGQIDLEKLIPLVDKFIESGYSYFDAAYVYKGAEVAFREAVAKRYPRDKYTIATKQATWLLSDTFSAEKMFDEQLERLGVDYIDYYLLHSLQNSRMECVDKFDSFNFGKALKEQGKIKYFGFSFHGGPELLDKLLTDYPFVDFVQLQINYTDWEDATILAGANYQVALKHNKDIVVMEPVKGGILSNPKQEAVKVFADLGDKTPSSYAFRFVAGLENVKMVLSGMNNMSQMLDNVSTFDDLAPLTDIERAALDKVNDIFRNTPVVPCTDCRYCVEGCPQKIRIPDIFKAYNSVLTFGDHNRPHWYYNGLVREGGGKAIDCISCGACESTCPQHIEIIETLKKASKVFD